MLIVAAGHLGFAKLHTATITQALPPFLLYNKLGIVVLAALDFYLLPQMLCV